MRWLGGAALQGVGGKESCKYWKGPTRSGEKKKECGGSVEMVVGGELRGG